MTPRRPWRAGWGVAAVCARPRGRRSRGPGDVVDRAGAADARSGGGVVAASGRPLLAPPCRLGPARSRAPARGRSGWPPDRGHTHAPVEALNASSAGISGWRATSGSSSRVDRCELEGEPSGSAKRSALLANGLDALLPSRPSQKSSASSDATRQRIGGPSRRPARPGTRFRVLEEGQVGAGLPIVGVEQVVDGRVVLVHGLLDQPKPQHTGVEVEVPRGVTHDAGDIRSRVPVQAHGSSLRSPLACVRVARRSQRRRAAVTYRLPVVDAVRAYRSRAFRDAFLMAL